MVKKEAGKKPKVAGASGPRVRKLTKRQQKVKAKQETRRQLPMIGSFRLSKDAFQTIAKHWKPLGGIMLVYLIFNLIFTGSLGRFGPTVDAINESIESAAISGGGLGGALSGFSALATTSSGASESSSLVQNLLFLLVSLVIIWALRHLLAGRKIGIKQAYYQSMAPLVPFLLVVLVIIIQLIPLAIGAAVFSMVLINFAGEGLVIAGFGLMFALLAAWSLYMLAVSILAIYIVTLPDMHPLQALRSAKNLVRFRRLSVLRRLLFLPILLIIGYGVIIIPLIYIYAPLATGAFYVLGALSILFVHTYLYSFYRSLL